jgi:cathepsin L
VPARLKYLIAAQNSAAASLNLFLGRNTEFMRTNPRLAATPKKLEPKWDWRERGFVSPVKNQTQCGSCWAFGAVAAYESAYAITNNQWAYVSEQELLDCTFADSNCVVGGWHQQAFLYLQYLGAIDSNRYFYTGMKGQCATNFSREYYVLNWGYVGDTDGIPADAALKTAIRQYGPIATSVLSTNWDSYWKVDAQGNQNPAWYSDFPNAVFKGAPSDPKNPGNIDHIVAIVGWDDTVGDHGVWIIKNSWGTYWGDGGYMKLSYGANNIGYGAAWVLVPPTSGLSSALIEELQIPKRVTQFGTVKP